MKTTTTDKPINTLEKINTVENQKNTPEITSAIKQEQQPTPFTNPTITKINTSQPSIIPIISTTKKPEVEQTQTPVTQKKQATSIIPTIINKTEQQPATEQMVSQAISVLPSQ